MLVSCAVDVSFWSFHRGMSGLKAVPVIRLSCALMVRVLLAGRHRPHLHQPAPGSRRKLCAAGRELAGPDGPLIPKFTALHANAAHQLHPITEEVRPYHLWGETLSGKECV